MQFDDQNVIIPDVSFYQDDDLTITKINFAAMRSNNAVGVILRGGQNTWMDEDVQDYLKEVKQLSFPYGSYWLYDSRANPVQQAKIWHDALGGIAPPLGLWIDLEENYGGAYKGEIYWRIFYDEVRRYFPTAIIGIYTSWGWWNSQFIVDIAFWSSLPLWLASYTSNPVNVALPRGWTKCLMWQYTSKGNGPAYGVESLNIDLSKFNGTISEFYNYFNITPTGEPHPMADYMKLEPVNSGNTLSIRQQVNYPRPPHITGQKIGQINVGNSAKALPTDFYTYAEDIIISGELFAKKGDIWWKTFESNGSPIAGWCAEIHKGVRYLNTTLVQTTPPPTPAHVVEVYIDGVLEYRKELL